jgi:hypothetical protein
MKTMFLSVVLLTAIASACAADLPSLPTAPALPAAQRTIDTARAAALKSWEVSLIPLVASQAFDAASSYGMRELNPLLASANGDFEMKAISIKIGITAAMVGVEYLIIRKYPRSARVISKLNWTSGIVTTGFAIHNYAIK